MDQEYWLQRWRDGRIGWHHPKPMPLLLQHWGELAVPAGTRVLVPLCGKSVDMAWLARQGLRVLGVDVSPIAIETFLAEQRFHATTRVLPAGTSYTVTNPPAGGALEIVNGDVFGLDAAEVATCAAFYDRAATIAMPPRDRARLADAVYAKLPAGARGLLITLEYPEGEMEGPPFTVDAAEVRRLFATHWNIRTVERRDILAGNASFAANGVTALHTAVYALTRRATRARDGA